MNWEFLQDGITLMSVYVFLDTCLLSAVSTIIVLTDMIRARINRPVSPRKRLPPDATNQGPRRLLVWAARLLAVLVFPFPLFCVYPVIQLSQRLHARNPLLFHRMVKACSFVLTSGLAVGAWFHNGSLWAWITCLVWAQIIDLIVDNEDEDDEDDEDDEGDEDGPDDPTPHADAAELWLRSLRRAAVSSPS